MKTYSLVDKIKNKIGKDANLKELLSGSAITFVVKIIGMLINYGVVLLISYKHGAEGVGVFGVVNSLITFLALFCTLGTNVSVLRFVGQFKTEDSVFKLKHIIYRAMKLAIPTSIIVGTLVFYLSDLIALKIFKNIEYSIGLKIGAVALPFFTLNSINIEFIRGLKKLKISEYFRSIHRFLIVLIILASGLFNYEVLNSLYGLGVGIVFTFLLSTSYILLFFYNRSSISHENFTLTTKELFNTSTPMMTAALCNFALNNMGLYFVEFFSTTQETGIYNVAFKLAQLVSLALLVINTISAPKFSEMYWNNKIEELKTYLRQASKTIFYISLVSSVIIMLLSESILSIFGEDFISGQWALFYLITGQVISAIAGSVGIFMNMTGNHSFYTRITFYILLFSVPLNFVMVKNFGMNGAAISSLISVASLNIIAAVIVYKKIGFTTFYNPFKTNKINE